jgi:putative intracellular protease/amidase
VLQPLAQWRDLWATCRRRHEFEGRTLERMAHENAKQIGIVLFDDVEELDAVGPWEVLAWWTHTHPEDGYAVTTLAPNGGTVTCAGRLRIEAEHAFADAPALDVLVHPGGRGTRPQCEDESYLDWIRERAETPR